MNKKNLLLFIIICVAVFSVNGQDGGSAEVLPEPPLQMTNQLIVNPSVQFSFGNVLQDDYSLAGKEGQGTIAVGAEIYKFLGPILLVGNISDTIGLSQPNSFNFLELSLTPVLFLSNITAGVMFSAKLPFYNGRLIGTQPQLPSDLPVFNIATWGIMPAIRYSHPFKWGSISATALFFADQVFATKDWNLSGDFELGVNTGIGIGAFVSPNFFFLGMGDRPEYMFTSVDVQLSYMNPPFPVSGSLTLTFPGSQEDGFKKYGMMINPVIHFYPNMQVDIWLSALIARVGNDVGNKIAIEPSIGVKYYPPLRVQSSSRAEDSAGADDSGEAETDAVQSADAADVTGWHIGLAGGYSNNSLYASTAERPFTELQNGHGFEAAIPIRYRVNSWLAFQGEIQYIQKNYTVQRTGHLSQLYNTVTNHFIDFPIMANFSFGGEKLRVFANLGAYVGVWIYSRQKGTIAASSYNYFELGPDEDSRYYYYYHDYDEKVEFDPRRDARFDGGLLAGIGVQYAIPACTFLIEGRYNYGLTDLQQNYGYYMLPKMNSTFNVRLGVLLNMNIFKSSKRGN